LLPTASGAHAAVGQPFKLLDFPKARPVAYIEIPDGAIYVQNQDQARGYTRMVEQLLDVAIEPAETADALRERAAKL
jgi:hypothetical protein